MLLLVKNAHYFNETGSEIYKVCLDKDTSVLACKYVVYMSAILQQSF